MPEVWITGAGIISALGRGMSATWSNLQKEQTGISNVHPSLPTFAGMYLGCVPFSDTCLKNDLDIAPQTLITRASLLGITALKEAWQQAGLKSEDAANLFFFNGITVGGMDKSEQYYSEFLQNDQYIHYISSHDCGACTEKIAAYFGDFSMKTTFSTACSSAANAFVMGANMIRHGLAERVIVGGTECLTHFHINGFKALMIVDANLCKPFDKDRAGINLGEGAAYFVLESSVHAQARSKKPLAILQGWGNACDAYHQTASSPEGEGAFLAMQKALCVAGLQAEDIDYINAHGTGTQNNDLSEGRAIERLFPQPPLVSSTKGFTGHATSAAGALEAAICILAIQNNCIPCNLNLQQAMPELHFSPVSRNQTKTLHHVLSNSFGFGGNNTSLLFSNPQVS